MAEVYTKSKPKIPKYRVKTPPPPKPKKDNKTQSLFFTCLLLASNR